jgi:hypothetical protein
MRVSRRGLSLQSGIFGETAVREFPLHMEGPIRFIMVKLQLSKRTSIDSTTLSD